MAFARGYGNLYYYDVFPMVAPAGKETVIRVRPLGGRREFTPGDTYTARFTGHAGGNPDIYPASGEAASVTVICNREGGFDVPFTFRHEQEYTLRFDDPESGKTIQSFRLYCVEGDMVGLYPYIGDLHMHTTLSDGQEDPEVVCANYRAHGYDFMALTDHGEFYSSLRVRKFYGDLPVEVKLLTGEEVHMPQVRGGRIEPHTVSIGARYSINSLVEGNATERHGTHWQFRSTTPDCPDTMSQEAFSALMDVRMQEVDVPENVDALQAAGRSWIVDEIHKAGGLAIYPHPNWIYQDTYHVPDALHDYFVENKLFDAFEVLGGENYYEHNGFQTVRYYEDQAKGHIYPIVGSTDTHGSTVRNRNAYICSTLVFAPENEDAALVDAIRQYHSVAVDTISKEFRLVGHSRLVRYGCFLLKNFFPLHDELCQEEGRMMRQYATGTDEEKADALKVLQALFGRVEKQRKKYFAF